MPTGTDGEEGKGVRRAAVWPINLKFDMGRLVRSGVRSAHPNNGDPVYRAHFSSRIGTCTVLDRRIYACRMCVSAYRMPRYFCYILPRYKTAY